MTTCDRQIDQAMSLVRSGMSWNGAWVSTEA